MFLIIGKILSLDDPAKVGQMLGMYMVTVLVGLIIHGFLVLPLIYFIITRQNPWHLFSAVLQALVTALGTGSRFVYNGVSLSIFSLHCITVCHDYDVITI